MSDNFAQNRFSIHEHVLTPLQIQRMIHCVASGVMQKPGRGGVRNLLALPCIGELAHSDELRRLIQPILGGTYFPVRGILFDKTATNNWKVPWHQDVTVAVRERVEAEGYGPWSVKDGVTHVQPPVSILERMLTVRVHLDECGPSNGPLRVIAGTHRTGKLKERQAGAIASSGDVTICAVGAGGALIMRPLLLHASSPAASPYRRRVIHLDFAAGPLAGGPVWAELETRNHL